MTTTYQSLNGKIELTCLPYNPARAVVTEGNDFALAVALRLNREGKGHEQSAALLEVNGFVKVQS